MNGLFRCFLYLATISLGFFFLGRLFPKKLIRYERFPFRTFQFERNGEFYRCFGVRRWQNKLPDMSRIFPRLMPSKKLPSSITSENMESMIRETCIAELTHSLLCVMGFGCVLIWKGIGGWTISLLYLIGNLPFNIIQRYNRPKLVRLLKRMKTKKPNCAKKEEQESFHEEGSDIELQYRARA